MIKKILTLIDIEDKISNNKFEVNTTILSEITKTNKTTSTKESYKDNISQYQSSIIRLINDSQIERQLQFYEKNQLYKKIKKAVGLGNIRASISGGGALSMQDELFYDAIGVNLRIGYGLTETAPVLTLRNVTDKNFLGSVGTPVRGCDLKVVDLLLIKHLMIFYIYHIILLMQVYLDNFLNFPNLI